MGANASPVSTTAAVASAALWVMIIVRMATAATAAIAAMSFTPMFVRFFTVDVRKRPTIIATPNRLSTRPAFATAFGFWSPPSISVMYGLLHVFMLDSSEM